MARLPVSFFARPVLEVAPELVGCLLVHERGRSRRAGVIVEVEAYLGDGSDPASHAHPGPTPRNRAMFGPPGRFYVYQSMGLHFCANVVCQPAGSAAAVLLRAVEPVEGVAAMRRARGGRPERELTNGPGKLAQAFGITLDHYGRSAVRGALRIERPAGARAPALVAGPRIGIRRAADLPYRFFAEESPFVTRSPLNRRAAPVRGPRRSGYAPRPHGVAHEPREDAGRLPR